MRNRRRDQSFWAPVKQMWKTYHEALTILASMLVAGLVIGSLLTVTWYRHHRSSETLDQVLFPKEPDYVVLDHHPHVTDCFKVWTEDPHGNALLMVWSDGQIWRARTDNGKTLGQWELLAHVRSGGTP